MPCGAPSGPITVSTVTPVGYLPQARQNSAFVTLPARGGAPLLDMAIKPILS